MRIFQMLPTLAYGDAVGNDAVALHFLLESMGYETAIYAENIGNIPYKNIVFPFKKMPRLTKEDIVIYHFAIGCDLNYRFAALNCRKIMIYHNITPPEFFKGYSSKLVELTESGLISARYLADKVDYCLAVSEFNKQDLLKMGYKCPIDVMPVLIPFDDYKKPPSAEIIRKYTDSRTNLISTGRVVPNKKLENVIRTFYMYKKYYDPTARLFLVGSYSEDDLYYQRLRRYVEYLELEDVLFTGHVPFSDILAYFHIADTYLCMSEHEGFCVPLVEAMFFDIPVVAYDKCAIKYTLDGSGFLLEDNDPLLAAGVINRLEGDAALREAVIKKQSERLKDFSYGSVSETFKKCLEGFIARKQ